MPIFLPQGIKCGSCSGVSHRWENEEWKVLHEDIQVFSVRMEMWCDCSPPMYFDLIDGKSIERILWKEAIKREKREEKVFGLR